MKIGMVAPPWVAVPPLAYGGTELVIDILCRGLTQQGHDVMLFATGDSTCTVPTQYIFEKARGFKSNLAITEMRHALHHLTSAYEQFADCDVIHDHTIAGPLTWQPHTSPPLIATVHDPFLPQNLYLWQKISNRGGKIVTISENHASQVSSLLPLAKTIHHGLDPADFLVGSGDGDYFACVGRMSPDKGIHTACELAKETGVSLKIAAKCTEPIEKAYFQEKVKPLLDSQIVYLGELSREDTQRLFQGAKALLNPFAWAEPFGLVMIEALAAGTPVIASALGSAPEIIHNGTTGFVCNSRDEFLAAIKNIDFIERENCRKAIETTFSMKNMTDQYLELYRASLVKKTAITISRSNKVTS